MAKKVDTNLNKEVAEKKAELFSLRLKLMTGEEKNSSKVKAIRKEIARMLTKANTKDGEK